MDSDGPAGIKDTEVEFVLSMRALLILHPPTPIDPIGFGPSIIIRSLRIGRQGSV